MTNTTAKLQRAVKRVTEAAKEPAAWSNHHSEARTEDLRLLLSERAELLATVERMRPVLIECLNVYGHRNFTDRYGMADRIRAALTTGEDK